MPGTSSVAKAARDAARFAAIGATLALAGVVVFLAVMAFLWILSPTLADEEWVVRFVAFVCFLGTFTAPIAYKTLREVVEHVPPFASGEVAERKLELMVQNLRIRSKWLRVGATLALVTMVLIAVMGFTVAEEGNSTVAIGAIALLVIVIQALATIYRTNRRSAAFYDTMADYIQVGGDPQQLEHEQRLKLFTVSDMESTWSRALRRRWSRD